MAMLAIAGGLLAGGVATPPPPPVGGLGVIGDDPHAMSVSAPAHAASNPTQRQPLIPPPLPAGGPAPREFPGSRRSACPVTRGTCAPASRRSARSSGTARP